MISPRCFSFEPLHRALDVFVTHLANLCLPVLAIGAERRYGTNRATTPELVTAMKIDQACRCDPPVFKFLPAIKTKDTFDEIVAQTGSLRRPSSSTGSRGWAMVNAAATVPCRQ
ncbi:MAG: hypothetical protein CM1200mP41_18560 [Gammaproteobacteria bacterium]|nr:MAG: hypothetical protein CM1200mP41_18560 [Gammaproteobacteria bacterium]